MIQPGQEQPGTGARPLRADAERNRQRILRAAAEVFTTRGLQATLDDVAHQAGVGVGTVYRRFPDKESLVEALFEERMQALAALAERGLADPDAWAGLVSFLEDAAALLTRDRGLMEIFLYGRYGRDRVSRARSRMLPVVTGLVEQAQRDGTLRPDLRPTDVPFIVSMLAMTADYAGQVQPGIWRRYLALIIDGMRASRDGSSPLPHDALTPEQMAAVMRSASQHRLLPPRSAVRGPLSDNERD
jgi:AcrR family transcriptional regulator